MIGTRVIRNPLPCTRSCEMIADLYVGNYLIGSWIYSESRIRQGNIAVSGYRVCGFDIVMPDEINAIHFLANAMGVLPRVIASVRKGEIH